MKGIASGMVKTVVIRKRNIIMHGIIILVLAVADSCIHIDKHRAGIDDHQQ